MEMARHWHLHHAHVSGDEIAHRAYPVATKDNIFVFNVHS